MSAHDMPVPRPSKKDGVLAHLFLYCFHFFGYLKGLGIYIYIYIHMYSGAPV